MNFSKLDVFFQHMPKRGYPACELAVTKNGELVYRNAIGHSDLEGKKPVTPNDLYWIYSSSKVITCITALRLLEEGRISLDDPLTKYIPEFAQMQVKDKEGNLTPAKTPITLLHLFTMTAGFSYNENAPAVKAAIEKKPDALEFARALAKEPLAFEPGSHYRYSFCHDVLGAVIEIVTGTRLSAYMKQLIFDPLGLKNIGFHPTEEQSARISAMYMGKSGTNTPVPMECSNVYLFSDRYDGGGAGLFSSVDDYIKIITVIANGGTTKDGYSLLRPETIALAQKNLLHDVALNDFATNRLHGYGWGLCGRVHRDPIISLSPTGVGEFGWDSAANAFALVDPANRVALFFGTHVRSYAYGYHLLHNAMRDLVYECLAAD